MQLKLLSCALMVLLFFAAGRECARVMKAGLTVIDAYLSLTQALESALRLEGATVREVLLSVTDGPAAPFCRACGEAEDLSDALRKYVPGGEEERACLEEMKAALLMSRTSADREGLVEAFRSARERMSERKKRREETVEAKAELVPRVSLALGLMAAVLML